MNKDEIIFALEQYGFTFSREYSDTYLVFNHPALDKFDTNKELLFSYSTYELRIILCNNHTVEARFNSKPITEQIDDLIHLLCNKYLFARDLLIGKKVGETHFVKPEYLEMLLDTAKGSMRPCGTVIRED